MAELTRSTVQLGAVIRRARKSKELSQEQLGEIAGVRQASISKLENGKPHTQIQTLLKILAALDLELLVDERSKGTIDAFEDIF